MEWCIYSSSDNRCGQLKALSWNCLAEREVSFPSRSYRFKHILAACDDSLSMFGA